MGWMDIEIQIDEIRQIRKDMLDGYKDKNIWIAQISRDIKIRIYWLDGYKDKNIWFGWIYRLEQVGWHGYWINR